VEVNGSFARARVVSPQLVIMHPGMSHHTILVLVHLGFFGSDIGVFGSDIGLFCTNIGLFCTL